MTANKLDRIDIATCSNLFRNDSVQRAGWRANDKLRPFRAKNFTHFLLELWGYWTDVYQILTRCSGITAAIIPRITRRYAFRFGTQDQRLKAVNFDVCKGPPN